LDEKNHNDYPYYPCNIRKRVQLLAKVPIHLPSTKNTPIKTLPVYILTLALQISKFKELDATKGTNHKNICPNDPITQDIKNYFGTPSLRACKTLTQLTDQ